METGLLIVASIRAVRDSCKRGPAAASEQAPGATWFACKHLVQSRSSRSQLAGDPRRKRGRQNSFADDESDRCGALRAGAFVRPGAPDCTRGAMRGAKCGAPPGDIVCSRGAGRLPDRVTAFQCGTGAWSGLRQR